MNEDVMIDLETLARTPDARVLEVGAARFTLDLETGHAEPIGAGFFRAPAPGKQPNRAVEPETVLWHQERGERVNPTSPYGPALEDVLRELESYVAGARFVWIWGLDFDGPILRHAYAAAGCLLPWPYWAAKDARTVWTLAYGDQRPAPRAHAALGDCYAAIRDLSAAIVKLRRDGGTPFATLDRARAMGIDQVGDLQALMLLTEGQLNTSALARSLGLSVETARCARIRLEGAGLVTVADRPETDQRVRPIHLTEAGRELALALREGKGVAA